MRRPFLTGCLMGLTLLAGSPAMAGAPAQTTVEAARWDARHLVIELPYEGSAPSPVFYRLSPSHFYYDFGPARRAQGGVQFQKIGGAIERFTVANRADGQVRLAVQLNQDAEPAVDVQPARHRMLFYPLGRKAWLSLKAEPAQSQPVQPAHAQTAQVPPPPRHLVEPPKPVLSDKEEDWAEPLRLFAHQGHLKSGQLPAVNPPRLLAPPTAANALLTTIDRPALDDFHHRLVMPFKGEPPKYAIRVYAKNPRWVYLDFPHASFNPLGEHFDSYSDPVFEGWMLTQRDHGLDTRLYLKLKDSLQVVAQVFPESNEIWLTACEAPPLLSLPQDTAPAAPESAAAPAASPQP